MSKRYKLKKRCLYYEEEREFDNFLGEVLWMIKLRLNGWKIEKLTSR